jgi:ABC-type multidrug transport system permease subunit
MKITKVLKDMLIIAWIKSYPDFRRNPLFLIVIAMISAIPLFFMLVFSGGGTLIHGLIGAIVSSVAFLGVIAGIQDISWDRYVKIREMMVAMPVHPMSYALGIALAPLLVSIPSLILFGALAYSLGALTLEMTGWLVLALIVGWAAMSAIGFMISTYLFKASAMVLNNLSLLLGFGLVFIPPRLLFRGYAGESKLDINGDSNIKCGRFDQGIYGVASTVSGDHYCPMAHPHRNHNSIRSINFSEG